MFTVLSRVPQAKMSDNNQEQLQHPAVSEEKKRGFQEIPQVMTKTNLFVSEGSGQKDRDMKVYLNDQCSKTAFPTWNKKERNLESAMCEIRQNEKTEFEGDLEEVL